ncbi:hypothetical protein [Duganella sp. Root1480D1]|uniref:hypothetical protein n=1 Tax=Duganella sp. Root1480D1 TaxID=1736471 RepID=UPI00070E69B3|nr:hypothetical protein [Duganella sp. Root1480D1]KQZ32565.1 hypothetical protein ASD58_08025 [Duganella sp. Root1480D1]
MDSTQLLASKTAFVLRRMLAAYRLPFALAASAVVLLATAIAFYVAETSALQAARLEAFDLSKQEQAAAEQARRATPAKIDLKAFRSSHLLAILEHGASSANVKLDEISFAVEDSPNQPFVRYRASFQVLSRYPTVRKFISEILSGSEGVVLDTVSCRREDINAADVRCDISAYVAYREKAHG